MQIKKNYYYKNKNHETNKRYINKIRHIVFNFINFDFSNKKEILIKVINRI